MARKNTRLPIRLTLTFTPSRSYSAARTPAVLADLIGDHHTVDARQPVTLSLAPPEQVCIAPLAAAALAKGVSVDTLVRVAMHSLDTLVGFGKYATERVETVIRCDPRYAAWAVANVDRFQLGEDAADLLAAVLIGAEPPLPV